MTLTVLSKVSRYLCANSSITTLRHLPRSSVGLVSDVNLSCCSTIDIPIIITFPLFSLTIASIALIYAMPTHLIIFVTPLRGCLEECIDSAINIVTFPRADPNRKQVQNQCLWHERRASYHSKA